MVIFLRANNIIKTPNNNYRITPHISNIISVECESGVNDIWATRTNRAGCRIKLGLNQ